MQNCNSSPNFAKLRQNFAKLAIRLKRWAVMAKKVLMMGFSLIGEVMQICIGSCHKKQTDKIFFETRNSEAELRKPTHRRNPHSTQGYRRCSSRGDGVQAPVAPRRGRPLLLLRHRCHSNTHEPARSRNNKAGRCCVPGYVSYRWH